MENINKLQPNKMNRRLLTVQCYPVSWMNNYWTIESEANITDYSIVMLELPGQEGEKGDTSEIYDDD